MFYFLVKLSSTNSSRVWVVRACAPSRRGNKIQCIAFSPEQHNLSSRTTGPIAMPSAIRDYCWLSLKRIGRHTSTPPPDTHTHGEREGFRYRTPVRDPLGLFSLQPGPTPCRILCSIHFSLFRIRSSPWIPRASHSFRHSIVDGMGGADWLRPLLVLPQVAPPFFYFWLAGFRG